MDAALNDRRLARVAAAGVAFTVVVVAASALLRLGTTLDAGGNAASTLAPALESVARIAHRVSASAVGLLAIAAIVLALRDRPVPCGRRAGLVAIVVFTAVLAAIGRYTPGYRFTGVTVANAVLGVALAAAFAWLRLQSADRGARLPRARLLVLAAVLAEIALGTAASAAAMHGRLAFEPLHVALGPAVAALAAWAALGQRGGIAALAIAQMALGIALAAMGASRALPGQWLHAMLACALVLALAGARSRNRTRPQAAGEMRKIRESGA
ncbi:MAG TPA: hypothetical protein VLS49_06125 [Usitatibacter sp.]|nr:hypothetical protein [Usitatibacter sp.]